MERITGRLTDTAGGGGAVVSAGGAPQPIPESSTAAVSQPSERRPTDRHMGIPRCEVGRGEGPKVFYSAPQATGTCVSAAWPRRTAGVPIHPVRSLVFIGGEARGR